MPELTRRALLAGGLSAGALATTAGRPPGRRGPHAATATVFLVRHGQTWLNPEGLAQGWSDTPLTATWATTAQTIGKNLAARDGSPTAAYSADMVRQYETATGILQGARARLPVTRDPRLREAAFGGFEATPGLTMWDAAAGHLGYAGMAAALQAGKTALDLLDAVPAINPYPDQTVAETTAAVAARMQSALDGIAADARGPAPRILVVSSGLSISALLASWGLAAKLPPSGLGNGAVNRLEHTAGTWTVKSVNDMSYQD